MRRSLFLSIIVVAALSAMLAAQQNKPSSAAGGSGGPKGMTVYDTRYYIMHTDLDAVDAREAAIRMTKMAEEYHARTADFSGTISQKLPFFLFKNSVDYYASGGLPGSAGVFTGTQLMAIAGEHPTYNTWHVVQHEGFHQFAAAVIGGQMPTWLNEGLAEYFGEAVFTGDSFISGAIPSMRLRRVRAEMSTANAGGFRPIAQLMTLSHKQWNSEMSIVNYDQAWSIVHFLAHGDNGKYQKTFNAFMRELSKGGDWEKAWQATFGDVNGFEQRWRDYWQKLPDRPTDALYAEATVTTLTGFLGRCGTEKQYFSSFEDYLAAIESNSLKISDSDWLPPALIVNAAAVARRRMEEGTKFSLSKATGKIVCTMVDGTKITGSYSVYGGKSQVTLEVVNGTGTGSAMSTAKGK